jgi:adenosine kinase
MVKRGEKILVCGSVAIDIIGYFPGSFQEYEDRHGIRALNASLQLSSVVRSFGGCGINITYGLNRLGVAAIPLAMAGVDFDGQYRGYLQALGIDTRNIVIDPDFATCATAIILSDCEGNQLTAFQSGPARSNRHPEARQVAGIEQVGLAIVTPDDAHVMLRHAHSLVELGIPVMLDPGQGLAGFEREPIEELMGLANHVIVNAREWERLQELSGRSVTALCDMVESVIVTRGRAGAIVLLRDGSSVEIPALPAQSEVDATGCGDAFRAGYLTGLIRGAPVEVCGRMGALVATYNLESPQTQNYLFTQEQFAARFKASFGMEMMGGLTDGVGAT